MGRRNKGKERVRIAGKLTTPEKVIPKYKIDAKSMVAKTSAIVEVQADTPPQVWYSNRAWHKIVKAIHICPDEVGWLGTVDTVEGGYLITDIFVPKQIVHGAETDIDAEALADLSHELDYPDNLYYWGHSHVNMACTPSGQDEEQTSEYLEHCDVFIRGIYNKKGDNKVDVFDMADNTLHQKVRNGIRIEPLPEEEMDTFVAGVKENVKKRVPLTTTTTRPAAASGTTSTPTQARVGTGGGVTNRSASVFNNPFIKRGVRPS